ncbi:hypothetical protein [Stygiolobus caldivivus]|uniref:Uncharacterized protein n=1 Tax=Stygiolobus caldivivus TaxID=2824673 RepID=A0A8D5U534_9CREN|nr:hypothetical protein [Stygiolobus caldivivus]BCU69424.1 hypothetical protein KN1_07210 [Stygiolobus caldivivus]
MITEGYFVKYKGIVWAVKGCYHPEGYVVAIPRLYEGRKIKKLNEAIRLVKEKFPNLMKYLDQIGFEVPLVPLEESEVLDPFEVKRGLPTPVKVFLSYFRDSVGITGSLLYSDSFNDMDFLSFDPYHYKTLLELREKGVTLPLTSWNENEVEVLDKEDFIRFKKDRVLEGVFQGFPYTFKVVECIDFGTVIGKKNFRGTLKIVNAVKPFSLPVIYETEQGITLTSFRIRFTELKEGATLYVDGILLERNKFLDLDLDIANEVKVM